MNGTQTTLSQKTFSNKFIIGLLRMWLNLLGQNIHTVILIFVSWPFSPQLGAFDGHPQASGCPLAEFLATPLDRISEVQLHLLASSHRLVLSAQSTSSWWSSGQDFDKTIPKPRFLPDLATFDVRLGSLSHRNTQLHPRANLLADDLEIILLLHYSIYFL